MDLKVERKEVGIFTRFSRNFRIFMVVLLITSLPLEAAQSDGGFDIPDPGLWAMIDRYTLAVNPFSK